MHTVSWKGGRFGWAAAPGTTWRLLAVRLGYRAVVLLGFALTSGSTLVFGLTSTRPSWTPRVLP